MRDWGANFDEKVSSNSIFSNFSEYSSSPLFSVHHHYNTSPVPSRSFGGPAKNERSRQDMGVPHLAE
jgi:hypothetical protein